MSRLYSHQPAAAPDESSVMTSHDSVGPTLSAVLEQPRKQLLNSIKQLLNCLIQVV